MAITLACLRRSTTLALSNGLFLNPLRSARIGTRSFSDDSQATGYNENDRAVDVQRQPDTSVTRRRDSIPTLFSDGFDPFSPSRSLSQVFNLMDQLMDDSFFSPSPRWRNGNIGLMRGWNVKEDNEALYLKINMPGLGKENVKVWVEQNTLVIKGEGEKEPEDDDVGVRRYSSRIDLPTYLYKVDEIKAEMKHGVLGIVVPKVKEKERKDVVDVQVGG